MPQKFSDSDPLPTIAYEQRDTIALPEGVGYENAQAALERAREYARTPLKFHRFYGGPVWYVAVSAWEVLSQRGAIPVPEKHQELDVATPRGNRRAVVGLVGLPDGSTVELGGHQDRRSDIPQLVASFKCLPARRAYCEGVADAIEARWQEAPCTAGGALQLECDEDGDIRTDRPFPIVGIAQVRREAIILPPDLERAVSAHLFAFLRNPEGAVAGGMKPQRSALLVGAPGTGKSLTATALAGEAAAKGWSVLYATESAQALQALELARQLAPALLILEDLDRTVEARPGAVKALQNALDGVRSGKAPLLVLATSNVPDKLPSPMLRPGRFDSVLHFTAPDATAAARLVQSYLPAAAPELLDAELQAIGEAGRGLLPATLREAVNRAALYALDAHGDACRLDAESLVSGLSEVRAQDAMVRAREAREAEPMIPTLRVLGSSEVLGDRSTCPTCERAAAEGGEDAADALRRFITEGGLHPRTASATTPTPTPEN